MEEMDHEQLERRVADFFKEDNLLARIHRKELCLKIRILFDSLAGYFYNQDDYLSEETRQCWQELRSLAFEYTFTYPENSRLEDLKQRWRASIPKDSMVIISYK